MNKRIVTAGLALTLLGSMALTGRAQSSGSVVKPQGYLSVDAVRPGDKFKIAISLHVADGYHINAHIPSEDYLVPTTLTLAAPNEIRVGVRDYPATSHRSFEFSPDKKLAVHEGTVTLTADADASRGLQPGDAVIKGQVQVQSCNESQCLAPATLNFEIPFKVVAAGSAVNAANQDIFSAAGGDSQRNDQSPSTSATPAPSTAGGGTGPIHIDEWLAKYGFVPTLLIVFILGVGLNATPCVFPIIPITIGFFANQGKDGESSRLG